MGRDLLVVFDELRGSETASHLSANNQPPGTEKQPARAGGSEFPRWDRFRWKNPYFLAPQAPAQGNLRTASKGSLFPCLELVVSPAR